MKGFHTKRLYIAHWANFWQTDLFWHEKHCSIIVVFVDLQYFLRNNICKIFFKKVLFKLLKVTIQNPVTFKGFPPKEAIKVFWISYFSKTKHKSAKNNYRTMLFMSNQVILSKIRRIDPTKKENRPKKRFMPFLPGSLQFN